MHMAYAICIETDVSTKKDGRQSVSGFLSRLAPHIIRDCLDSSILEEVPVVKSCWD